MNTNDQDNMLTQDDSASKVVSYVVKSSVYFHTFSIYVRKILITTLWNVVEALHKPKGKTEYAKVPHWHVKVFFS